jgi:hypothetical protein
MGGVKQLRYHTPVRILNLILFVVAVSSTFGDWVLLNMSRVPILHSYVNRFCIMTSTVTYLSLERSSQSCEWNRNPSYSLRNLILSYSCANLVSSTLTRDKCSLCAINYDIEEVLPKQSQKFRILSPITLLLLLKVYSFR